MRRYLVGLLLLVVINVFGQGPGGVPVTNLVSWEKPVGIVANGSGKVTAWADASGNGNAYNDHGTASKRPTLVVGDANGLDVVRFDGTNDYLEGTGVSYQAQTVFVVFKANSALQSSSDLAQIWGHDNSGIQLALETRPGSGGPGKYSVDGNSNRTGKVGLNGERYDGALKNPFSPTAWQYDEYTIVALQMSAVGPVITTQIIGDLIAPANHNFGGEIAEVIVFNSTIDSDVEKLRINNYLGEKYNISLTPDTDNTLYTDATYNKNLLVMGNHNGVNYDSNIGKGGAGYISKNAGSFGVGEKIWLAHNGTNHGISNLDVSGGSRWKRIYRLQRDNSSGTLTSIDVSFGTQEAGLGDNDANGRTIADYKLLYRAGTSGTFTEVTGAVGVLDAGKNKVIYTVNNADLAYRLLYVGRARGECLVLLFSDRFLG